MTKGGNFGGRRHRPVTASVGGPGPETRDRAAPRRRAGRRRQPGVDVAGGHRLSERYVERADVAGGAGRGLGAGGAARVRRRPSEHQERRAGGERDHRRGVDPAPPARRNPRHVAPTIAGVRERRLAAEQLVVTGAVEHLAALDVPRQLLQQQPRCLGSGSRRRRSRTNNLRLPIGTGGTPPEHVPCSDSSRTNSRTSIG